MQARWELSCALCGQAYGACIQCAGSQACVTAFHPLCARAARLRMAAVPDFSADSDSDDAADQAAIPDPKPGDSLPDAHAAGEGDLGGCGGRADGVEGAGGAPLDGAAGRRAKRRRHAPQPGGTALADGRRLVCFCARHAAADANPVPYAGPGAAADGAGAAGQGVGAGGACVESRRIDCAGAAAAHSAAPGCPPCSAGTLKGSSRTRPFDHALRRGARAPEALAAALAKRLFVRARPYVVSTARAGAAPPPSRCFRVVAPSAGGSCDMARAKSGSRAESGVCLAARLHLREVLGPWVPGAVGANPAGSGWPAPTTLATLLLDLQRSPSGGNMAPKAAEAGAQADAPALAGPSAGERGVLSLAERMATMRRTLARRMTCGARQQGLGCDSTPFAAHTCKSVWLAELLSSVLLLRRGCLAQVAYSTLAVLC